MELSEEDKQQKLFGALLGFKVGDRVKTRVKVYSWRRNVPPRFYWKYGKVVTIVDPDYFTKEERVNVIFSGDFYSHGMKVSDLVRSRAYVRKKV